MPYNSGIEKQKKELKMLKIKMNEILNTLGVKFRAYGDEFIITIPEIPHIKNIVDYNDFPQIKYDYNLQETYIEVEDCEKIDEILSEIIKFIIKEKDKIKKTDEKLKEKIKEI